MQNILTAKDNKLHDLISKIDELNKKLKFSQL